MSGFDDELTPSQPGQEHEGVSDAGANPDALVEGNEVAHEEDMQPPASEEEEEADKDRADRHY